MSRTRRDLRNMGAVLASVALVLAVIAGCQNRADDCALNLVPCNGTTTTSSTGGGGTGGGVPVGCDPSKATSPVADSCGVFVSPAGDDKNPGTKAKPLKSFKAALMKGSTIYACGTPSATMGAFTEAVVLDNKATLFGALDCAKGWAYDASKKTRLTTGNDQVPLTLSSSASGSEVLDFIVTAADAMALGGSSIAVVADSVTASFSRTDIIAGNGHEGEAGATPSGSVGPTDPNDAAIKGNDGKNACMDPAVQLGGAPADNPQCASTGGLGGAGAVSSGSSGDAQPANAQTALGGQGQPTADPTWSCVIGAGAIGGSGGTGTAGTGATSTDLGAIDKTGYAGVGGKAGDTGKPGQGGGGGGGAKGKTSCAGASGGGGGAGGCGGAGGTGGKAGGVSIAIISLGATLSFDAVTIKVGSGGKGGDGGDGQVGGTGGNGGQGGLGNNSGQNLSDACGGGKGGQGGSGGKGGGGRGGHAIGIAHTGTMAPSTSGVTFANKGMAGGGGSGDHANGNMGDGQPGVVANVQAFP